MPSPRRPGGHLSLWCFVSTFIFRFCVSAWCFRAAAPAIVTRRFSPACSPERGRRESPSSLATATVVREKARPLFSSPHDRRVSIYLNGTLICFLKLNQSEPLVLAALNWLWKHLSLTS